MKLCMIGTGYVGLVSGVCFADLGNEVICVDNDIGKINLLKNFDVSSYIIKGKTGVWVKSDNIEKKIAAIGVRISNGISMHGFALNVNTDLSYFDYIVPCGIKGKGVTSMENELGEKIPINEVKEKLTKHFEYLFEANFSR